MKTEGDTAGIGREVEETLAAFDRRDELLPDPLFYERLRARLAEEGEPRGAIVALWKPALLAVLAVLNLSTAIWYLGARQRPAAVAERATLTEVLAADLNLGAEPEWPFDAEQE